MNQRDPRFDTVKAIVIILVVFAHLLSKSDFFGHYSRPLFAYLYSIIYSFHMPAVIFISGFFSRSADFGQRYFRKQAQAYLLPFLLMNGLLWLLFSRSVPLLLFPQYAMWFLLSLFFWKLALPVAASFRFSFVLSVLVTLLIGFPNTVQPFALSKAISFFPFFLGGYLFRPEYLEKLRRLPKLLPAAALLAVLGFAAYLQSRGFRAKIYYLENSYTALHLIWYKGICLRLYILAAGFTAALSLLALVPKKQTVITFLGERTVTIYLLHALFIMVLTQFRFSVPIRNDLLCLLVILGMTAAICAAAGNRFVVKLYRKLMQKLGALCFRSVE